VTRRRAPATRRSPATSNERPTKRQRRESPVDLMNINWRRVSPTT
jgi:hypothetical protein